MIASRVFAMTVRAFRPWAIQQTALVPFVALLACGCSPTTPSTTTTRTIGVLLAEDKQTSFTFGDYVVGSVAPSVPMTITNSGNAPLTISAVLTPHGFTSNWNGGVIAANQSQAVTITFTPDVPGSYSGTIAVNGDQTGGVTTVLVSGFARQSFVGPWSGTLTISAPNQSTICDESWMISTDDSEDGIWGTWQSHGASTSCESAGVLDAFVQDNVILLDLQKANRGYAVLGGSSDCAPLGNPHFAGTISFSVPGRRSRPTCSRPCGVQAFPMSVGRSRFP
jgi:hypothetical protein